MTYDDVTTAISLAQDNLLALYNKINDTNQSNIVDAVVFKFGKSLIKNTHVKVVISGQQILATLFGKQDAINKCSTGIMEIGLLNSLVAGLYGWAKCFANDKSMKSDPLHIYLNFDNGELFCEPRLSYLVNSILGRTPPRLITEPENQGIRDAVGFE